MAANICHSFVCFVFVLAIAFQIPTSSGQLTTNYYADSCPRASDIVAEVVQNATKYDPRMGASLLRLHFHDCFVNGCDGSVLLADTPTFTGEQTAIPNNNSLRGFDVVAKINAALKKQCGCVVSCADMLAMAARYSVADLGGPWYDVLLGRKDSKNASFAAVLQNLPSPFSNFAALVANFASHSLNLTDLVVLSGAHTIGFARCTNFMTRIYKDGDINATFAGELQQVCPNNPNSVNATSVLWPLDNTTKVFDKKYYEMLQQETGLLHSDQELYSGGNSTSANLVTYFSNNQDAFFEAFKVSIIKMGNLPPSNNNTEIRCNCSIPNSPSPPPPSPSPPPPSPPPPSPSPPPPSPPPPTSSPDSGISISVNLPGISVSIP